MKNEIEEERDHWKHEAEFTECLLDSLQDKLKSFLGLSEDSHLSGRTINADLEDIHEMLSRFPGEEFDMRDRIRELCEGKD